MTLSIDLNNIKNGLITAYHTASAKASEWLGRGIAIIKSGTEKALPYLQDKRIAAVSLIALNLILIEIAHIFSKLIARCLPHRTEGQKIFREAVEIVSGLGVLVGGVAAFAKYTKLPFSGLAVFGISAGTFVVRVALDNKKV